MCERGFFGYRRFYGHGGGHPSGPSGCCCGLWMRRFPSREEQVKVFEEYKKDLEEELVEVNKHLDDLKK